MTTGYLLLAFNNWLLTTGYLLLAFHYWLLTTGFHPHSKKNSQQSQELFLQVA